MNEKTSRKDFVRAGAPVGVIGGTDHRFRREGDALVVLPDEVWGNPLYAAACLDEADFHIHARLTIDRLTGSGASVLLGGHYHYLWSRPEGNLGFRVSLDEDISPQLKTLAKDMRVTHGRVTRRGAWFLAGGTEEKQVSGKCRDFFRPGEPFTVDIYRRGDTLSFEINSREVFHVCLSDGTRFSAGRCGDDGWPISFGFIPGRAALRIHDFYAEGRFCEPAFPTTDVWRLNSDGYNSYRLPALLMTPGGRLFAFAEAKRSFLSRGWEWENNQVYNDLHCAMKYSDDNGRTWSEQKIIVERGASYEARDPSPVVDRETGEIFVFTRGGPWMVTSRDNGRTWSEPKSLAGSAPGNFIGFSPGTANSAIQLRHGPFRGRLLLAVAEENVIGLIFSDDHGQTWQPGALTPSCASSEPCLIELSDGRIIVSPRDGTGNGGRLFLISADGGASFAERRYESAIPIPGQGELLAYDPPDAAATEKIRPLVCCGATENKTRLTLLVSLDDGATWPISRVIDDGSAANLALVALPGGELGVLYERDKYRRLSFQRVNLAQIINESR
jgi:sialidase-1